MVRVSDPGEGSESAQHDGYIRNDSHNQNGIMIDIVVSEIVDDLEQEPENPRQGTTAVDSTEMLKNGCAA